MSKTEQEHKVVVRQGYDALDDRDRATFRAMHAEDVLLHVHGEEIRGVDAVLEHQWGFVEAFPDLDYAMGAVVAEGDVVAARHTATGTHDGELQDIPPTGEEVEMEVMVMFRLEDDEVAEVWLTYDRLGMLQQLGVVEPPTE